MTTDKQKAGAIYNWVKNTIDWNNKYSYFTSKSLKEIVSDKVGNSADINLLLTAMLREADLKASPVIMSTREHGKVLPFFPMIDQINYVILHVQIGDKAFLIDATDRLNPPGLLPFRCLNGKGLLIEENNAIKWVDLYNGEQYNTSTNVILAFNKDMHLEGCQFKTYSNLSASDFRRSLIKVGKDNYIQTLSDQIENWNLEEVSFRRLENLNRPVKRVLEISTLERHKNADIIYLDLIMGGVTVKENPFKKETRLYPIDYGCPIDERYILSFKIPEGYELAELPEGINMALPENAGRYSLIINQNGQKLKVISQFNINKMRFLPGEYPLLKEFYNRIIAKESQKIVLKKNTARTDVSAN